MTWTRILYGTLIAAGLTATGTYIWDANRPHIYARDFIALFQAVQERCLATEYVAGTNDVVTTTNKVREYNSNDPSGLWFVDGGITNYYKTVSGTNDVVVVSTNSTALFRHAAINRSKTYHTATTNRYIWGPYSNYVVTGFSGGIGGYANNFNGTYTFYRRTQKIVEKAWSSIWFLALVDEYWKDGTNTYTMEDYGPQEGQGYTQTIDNASCVLKKNGVESFYTSKGDPARFGPWHSSYSFYGSADAASFVASGLLTNSVRGAAVTTRETQLNSIDRIIPWDLYTMIGDKIHEVLGLNETVFFWYVDDSQATAGEFQNFTNLPGLVSSSLWTRLSFPLFVTNSYDGAVHGIFRDEATDQNGSYIYVYATNKVLQSTNFIDRAKVLASLKWTHSGEAGSSNVYGCSWSTNLTENYWVWTGNSADSWADAKTACEGAFPIKYTSAMRPLQGTTGTKGPGGWVATAYAAKGQMIVAGSTQMEHTVDFYYRTQTYGTNVFTNAVFSDLATGLQDGLFKRLETSSAAWGAVTSSVVGSTDFPATWCDEPTESASKSLGWEIEKEDAVLKWSFQYCTNSL